ncbi:MAG TPA: hypothetical protein VM328_04645 [Fimbriimonadaceae bacterium]|nr:hypothetical protein [Fimbriimonadaceae bacterium]
MFPPEDDVVIRLSPDEAWELLRRCLHSPEDDTALSKDALKKLARALQAGKPPAKSA